MFDTVLGRDELPKRRFGVGAVISALLHASAVVFVIWASAQAQSDSRADDVAVTFVKPPPPPPPPPAPKQARPKPKPSEPKTVLAQAIVAPTEIPTEKPPEQEPAPDAPVGDGMEGGDVGGVPGGIVGGVVDAADVPAGPVQFNETMAQPVYISGPSIQYTERALEHEVQGTMVIKCLVTVQGDVRDCQVMKGLPFMDRVVVKALEGRRYKPATLDGQAIDVLYDFKIKLVLPQ